jgi:signal peptidase
MGISTAGTSRRIAAAILLLVPAVLMPIFVKKRSIYYITKDQVLLLMAVIALLYVMGYYLSGIPFGFYKNPYRLTFSNFFTVLLPTAAVIVFTEVIRYVTLAQRDKLSTVLCWLSCVIADMLLCSNLPSVTSFNRFMDLLAGAFFPAVIANCLYHYLSKRYGMYPNLVFRLITVLHVYILPVSSGISDSLLNFFKILLPIAIYYFIDSLFEKKRHYALGNTSRFSRITSRILTVLAILIMTGTIALVSKHFHYGAYVIATESMTGELNKGDVAICQRYEDQFIPEGQVIVFEKYGSVTVHRVVDIKIINGITQYYTQGDANEDPDAGFITNAQIIGLVEYELPFLGYPTLWLRSLFVR